MTVCDFIIKILRDAADTFKGALYYRFVHSQNLTLCAATAASVIFVPQFVEVVFDVVFVTILLLLNFGYEYCSLDRCEIR